MLDYFVRVADGKIRNEEQRILSGANHDIGATFEPISQGGIWRTPQISGATALRVAAGGDAQDSPSGTGAWLILLEGLGIDGAPLTDTIATNGTLAGPASSQVFLRLNRATVIQSGTYALPGSLVGSHAADITIENAAGGTTWAIISAEDLAGVSQIGGYSLEAGKVGYATNVAVSVSGVQSAQDLVVYRRNILETAPPYSPLITLFDGKGLQTTTEFPQRMPRGPFVGPCDIGFLGRFDSASGEMSVQMSLLVLDNIDGL